MANKEKEKEREKSKIAQEMSATITSLKKKTECVRKACEQAWEAGTDREKDLAKKAKATLYEEMKGVSRVQNRAKRVGLDTERLERTQVEANEVYLDRGRGKGPQGAGKKSKGFEDDYEVGEGSPKEDGEGKDYAMPSKATEQTMWTKKMGEETLVRKNQRPSLVDYERPPMPPRGKDGKFKKQAEMPEAKVRNASDILMGKMKGKGEEKKNKGKAEGQASGSKTLSGSGSKKSSAVSKAEQEINREREDERAADKIEQSMYDREIRTREDEVEDLERKLAAKRAEIQKKKERFERSTRGKEPQSQEAEARSSRSGKTEKSRSSASSRVEEENRREREEEESIRKIEQSKHERDLRARKEEIEDLEEETRQKKEKWQKKRDRYERDEREKAEERRESEKCAGTSCKRPKKQTAATPATTALLQYRQRSKEKQRR